VIQLVDEFLARAAGSGLPLAEFLQEFSARMKEDPK